MIEHGLTCYEEWDYPPDRRNGLPLNIQITTHNYKLVFNTLGVRWINLPVTVLQLPALVSLLCGKLNYREIEKDGRDLKPL